MKKKTLKQLQQQFAKDISHNQSDGEYFANNFTSNQLIQIYRNNYYHNLTNALAATYGCVKRLVGTEFFDEMSQKYIQQHPLNSGNIMNYGAEFDDFILNFKPCKQLVYLSDVAKFEKYYEYCYNKQNSYLFHSKYPIIKIWQMDENSKSFDIDNNEDYLTIYYQNNQVIVERLAEQQYKQQQNEYAQNN